MVLRVMRLGAVLVVLLLGGLLIFNYFLRPIPAVAASPKLVAQETVPGSPPAIPWPKTGSAAVGVSGLGFIASSGNDKPVPAASVAKVMTALVVVGDHALQKGEQGPSITITDADVATYQADLADKQSVVLVRNGEVLTEFQALQGLLIPSGNNIADTLAHWDAGSTAAFVVKMNDRARALHLAHTTFADPSGVSIKTLSTPSDLMALGMAAMKEEVLAQIVALPQAVLPVAGVVYNVDYALGQNGIIGIKTGSGVDLTANFLFAASATVDGHPVTLFGCVMSQPTLNDAFDAAKALMAALQPALHVRKVINKNDAVGTYTMPWGAQSDLLATIDVSLVEWPGMVLRQRLDSPALVVDKPLAPQTREGSLSFALGDYSVDEPLVTASAMYPPGRLWRLTRITF